MIMQDVTIRYIRNIKIYEQLSDEDWILNRFLYGVIKNNLFLIYSDIPETKDFEMKFKKVMKDIYSHFIKIENYEFCAKIKKCEKRVFKRLNEPETKKSLK